MTRPGEIARLMGASSAAKYLGISLETLRKLGIPRKVLGSRRLYERSDLDAFADTLGYEDGEPPDDPAREWLIANGSSAP
ncbi:MAG: helix-turn-helix domain-containing protein [Pseudomonadota bacterium]